MFEKITHNRANLNVMSEDRTMSLIIFTVGVLSSYSTDLFKSPWQSAQIL